jgi:hypothetical protein
MKPITDFHNRLYQINTEVLQAPFPELSEEMARTTQRLKAEYVDSKFECQSSGRSIHLMTANPIY